MKKHELSNFIPINRRLFQHQLWCEERAFSRFEAWIYLLKEARFENTKVYDGMTVVAVRRGQIYASVRFLAKAFGWSNHKVLSFLKLLESDDMIRKGRAPETRQTLITICNYDVYNVGGNTSGTLSKQEGNDLQTKSNRENKEKRENTASSPGEAWRDSYEVYSEELKKMLDKLLVDDEFIAGRERFRPNIDIRLSLQKAYEDYWQTREAWERRRRRKLGEMDWQALFRNALDISQNWVAKERGQNILKNASSQLFKNEESVKSFGKAM